MFRIERYPVTDHELKNWVKFIWHFKADNVSVHHKLLPMDSIDILINLADEMIYETASERVVAPKVHVNSLRCQYSFIHQAGSVNVWGISFYSFGLYPFINIPIKDIQNHIADVNTLSIRLADKLKEAVSHETNRRIIESITEALNTELHPSDKCLKRAELIKEFLETGDNQSIHSFCLNHGISQRTFERFVFHITGYTPVNLRRIRRYQATSKQLLFDKAARISEIVYDNNYADQSHFIKEFRSFSGVPPKTFQQEKITVVENTHYI